MIGCSETRTVGARSVGALSTLPLKYTCSEQEFSSVQLVRCKQTSAVTMIDIDVAAIFTRPSYTHGCAVRQTVNDTACLSTARTHTCRPQMYFISHTNRKSTDTVGVKKYRTISYDRNREPQITSPIGPPVGPMRYTAGTSPFSQCADK